MFVRANSTREPMRMKILTNIRLVFPGVPYSIYFSQKYRELPNRRR